MATHSGKDLISGQPGAIPWMGTFVVNLQAIAATTPTYSTIVVIADMTPNHMVAVFNQGLISGATANNSGSTARMLFSVQPQDGQITLTYLNAAAAHASSDAVYSFIATRKTN